MILFVNDNHQNSKSLAILYFLIEQECNSLSMITVKAGVKADFLYYFGVPGKLLLLLSDRLTAARKKINALTVGSP